MAKNTLYEILEVSENASHEVIEKAYKILVKKYHPDLQPPNERTKAETKMKEINEAYEILGDEQKRKKYDDELRTQREELQRKASQVNQYNTYTNNQSNNMQNNNNANPVNNTTQSQSNPTNNYDADRMEYEQRLRQEEAMQRQRMQENLNKEYANAYNNYLRSLGYRVKERWTKERVRDTMLGFAIFIVIIIILWLFPPTHSFFVGLYEENSIIRTVVNIISSIIKGIFSGIGIFFANIFN